MGLSYNLKSNAFSLLELIIATAVLSIGIIVVLQAFSFAARTAMFSCDMIKAVFLSQDKMQELEFKEKQGLLEEEPSGTEGRAGKFQWKTELKADDNLSLYKFNFVVAWERANRTEEINLSTYLR